MNEKSKKLGDARGKWYYCFAHHKVETPNECDHMDRMGPYETPEDAMNWRERVSAGNKEWEEDE
jgi:hypothetical protein